VEADCVGGIEMGAVPLIAPVAMTSPAYGRHLHGFFVRKAVKDHGTKKRVDGADISGKSVVILEDVTTTGGSAMDAVKAVTEAGATGGLGVSILDRGGGGAEPYSPGGIPVKSLFRAHQFFARPLLLAPVGPEAVAEVLELVEARVADSDLAFLALALAPDLHAKTERLA